MNLKIKRMRELAGFFAQTVRTDGFGPTLKRSAAFLKRRFGSKKGRFLPKKETLAAQRALDYGALGWPAVSICVPLYNTPQKYLRQLLDSVLGQTCPNWQLCLADASDAAHGDVAQTVRAYQARDARIVYTKVENKGISANTNAAAALAAGEYLALADHDDVLAPHAVYEMMKARRFCTATRRCSLRTCAGPRQATSNRILRRITSTAAITSAIFPCSKRLCSTLWEGWTLPVTAARTTTCS